MLSILRLVIWSIIGIGLSSIAVQILTLREFLSQFYGNEITISLALFCWLGVTGLGSLLAKRFARLSMNIYSLLLLTAGVWPLLQVILIRTCKEKFFIHGVAPGFYQTFFFILATTAPYCLLSGFILPYALKVLQSKQESFRAGDLYILDNIGDIIGGMVFSFWLVYWATPFQAIALTSALLLFMAGWLLFQSSRKYLLLFIALPVTIVFYLMTWNTPFERASLKAQYGNIVDYIESPYGRIVVTREGQQHTFWEEGLPLYSNANLVQSEEKIHYPLSQLEKVENILLVSGGLGETIGEVQKYRPGRIDYVELDPHLTRMAQSQGVLPEIPNLHVINTDGQAFLREPERKYDAIIVDLPEPDTFQLNRFYTGEFFGLVKKALNPGGVLSFSLTYSPNYQGEFTRKKLSCVYNTAKIHFQNILVLPGEKAYFVCRDGALDLDIPARLKSKSIQTGYVGGYYYGNMTPERIAEIRKQLPAGTAINTDFNPGLIQMVFKEWFLKQGAKPDYFFVIFFLLLAGYFFFIKKEEYILFSTGLSAMGMEMVVIFIFQVLYGYIYLKIGAIITAFLLGLLPGAVAGNLKNQKQPAKVLLADTALLILLILCYVWVSFPSRPLNQAFILLYCFVLSFFCGYQFPLITALIGENQSPAAGCLAADLTGAAVGTLLTGTVLIPLWGIQRAVLFLIGIKVSSNLLLLLRR
jgi:spermidine synthase